MENSKNQKVDYHHPKPNGLQLIKTKYVKYPFSGTSKNLIDRFLVIAYDSKDIEHTLRKQEFKKVNIKKNYLKFADFQELPTIINEISFSYEKESQDEDLILQIIYPNTPKLFFLEKKYIKEQKEQFDSDEESNNYSIIISINPIDNDCRKKSFNGLGYVFYAKKEHKNENGEMDGLIYYPITYVILSEFPYYYHFNKICKNIYIQMKKKTDDIPIDIILFNAIKYCPSPINVNLNLSFGAQLSMKVKNEIMANDILKQLYSKNHYENLNGIPFVFFNQLSGYPPMDINLSFIFNLLEPRTIIIIFIFTFLEFDVIFFSTIPEILNIIMYIFSNLNYPFNDSIYYWHIVSVSKDCFMYNAERNPFVGKVSSTITAICGEYDADYNTTDKIKEHIVLDIDNKEIYHPTSDEVDQKSARKIDELIEYIDRCIADIDTPEIKKKENIDEEIDKNYFKDGINLSESIRNLSFALNRRFRIVTKTNYNERQYKPTFFVPYEDENEMDMMRENLQIQKLFYNFIVQILESYLSKFIVETHPIEKLEAKGKKKKLPLMINDKNKNIDKEDSSCDSEGYKAGLIFKRLFEESSKHNYFIENFCQYQDALEVSKISYYFIYEILYFSKIFPKFNLNEFNIFTIMDQFYGKTKKLDFLEIIKEKQEDSKQGQFDLIQSINLEEKMQYQNNYRNIYNFSYNKYETYYNDHLRAFINREQEEDKNIFIKDQGPSKQFKTYKRNNSYLSQHILELYMNYNNNNSKELKDIFKLINCEYKIIDKKKKEINNNNKKNNKKNIKENIIQDIKEAEPPKEDINFLDDKNPEKFFGTYELIQISDIIEKHLIMEKYFSSYEIMKFSLLNIIAITIGMKNKQINNVEVIKTICDFCRETNSLVRRYMNIYLNIFTTMKINKMMDEKQCFDCMNVIISYFKKTNTFPNEDTINPIVKSGISDYNEEINVDLKTLNLFISKSDKKNNREKRAEFYKKMDKKKEEQLIDYIEKVFSGWYYTGNKLAPNIEYHAKKFANLYKALINDKKSEFVPKTPLELYAITNKLLFEFLSKFYIEEKQYPELGILVLSLLYYLKMDFFLPKWKFKNDGQNMENMSSSNEEEDIESIKKLVVDLIYILLDLYEGIVVNIKK